MKKYLFGRKHFEEVTKARTYPLSHIDKNQALFDHGFLADRFAVWGKADGFEFAVVSRTYLSRKHIEENKIEGLETIFLDDLGIMGPDDQGLAIATFITGLSEHSISFVNMCEGIPVDLLVFLLPLYMSENGFGIFAYNECGFTTTFTIMKVE